MTEDDLLNRLLGHIERDVAPVTPVRPPWIRSLVPVAASLAIGALVISLAGLRPDVKVVGTWRLFGFTLAQVALCAGLFALGLRWSIPAMRAPLATAVGAAVGAVGVYAFLSWHILVRSALDPPFGSEVRTGLACLSAITVMSLAPMATGAVLLLRGLVTRWQAAFAVVGVASGLAAEALWRMHCQYSTWTHVLPFHLGALAVAVGVALALGISVRRATEHVLPGPWR